MSGSRRKEDGIGKEQTGASTGLENFSLNWMVDSHSTLNFFAELGYSQAGN